MVMNKKKQVFGVVENVEENKDYTGVKTKTANVTVDNTSREISVDVDFSSMLGETNQTAYPGHLGAQTRRFVLKAMDEVSSETARAIEAEERLEELIADTAWDIVLGDSEVKSKLYDEINRSKLAETQLQINIDELSSYVNTENTRIEGAIDLVKQEYAEKTYVDKKSSNLEEYVHATIDAIDLTPYAKKEELPTKLSQFENDSDYATKSDIPDVSSFIAEIPEEYVTEEELKGKGYFTKDDVEDVLLKIKFIDGGTSSSILK